MALAYFAEWLPWALNPKGLEFYYYFYPSIVCFGPALALVAQNFAKPWREIFLGATFAAALAMFRPIFCRSWSPASASVPSAFTARLWLPTWR